MPKRKKVIDVEGETTLPELPGKRELLAERDDQAVVPVRPPLMEILDDLAIVAGTEIRAMRQDAQEGERLSTDGSLKLRNITVAIGNAQQIQKNAGSDGDVQDASDDELRAVIEAATRELERRFGK